MKSKEVKVDNTVEAGKIWEEIKEASISMFALPNQKVDMYFTYQIVEPSKCYLLAKVPAAIPALETVVAPKFSVEIADKYTVVSRKK